MKIRVAKYGNSWIASLPITGNWGAAFAFDTWAEAVVCSRRRYVAGIVRDAVRSQLAWEDAE